MDTTIEEMRGMEEAAAAGAHGFIIESLWKAFPPSKTANRSSMTLDDSIQGGYLAIRFGIETITGTTPQSERWIGIDLTASFEYSYTNDTVKLSYLNMRPEWMTSTGKWIRGKGFYCPSVSVNSYGHITCSSGPSLNGGEGRGRMAVFTGMLKAAEMFVEHFDLEG